MVYDFFRRIYKSFTPSKTRALTRVSKSQYIDRLDKTKAHLDSYIDDQKKEATELYGLRREGYMGARQLRKELNKRRDNMRKLLETIAQTAAIIFLLIATAIFISNSNSPTGYAIFSSNILTLNLSPILGILSLIVALILLMNKE